MKFAVTPLFFGSFFSREKKEHRSPSKLTSERKYRYDLCL